MNQTAIYFHCKPKHAVSLRGENNVSILIGSSPSKNLTLCVNVAVDGTKLPLLVIAKPGLDWKCQLDCRTSLLWLSGMKESEAVRGKSPLQIYAGKIFFYRASCACSMLQPCKHQYASEIEVRKTANDWRRQQFAGMVSGSLRPSPGRKK